MIDRYEVQECSDMGCDACMRRTNRGYWVEYSEHERLMKEQAGKYLWMANEIENKEHKIQVLEQTVKDQAGEIRSLIRELELSGN